MKPGPRSAQADAGADNAGGGGQPVSSHPVTRVPGSTAGTQQPDPSVADARATHAKLVEEN